MPVLPIERRIWLIRGRRVMLDSDLAEMYGVSTKRLNEQVKRNRSRFPGDFMIRLSWAEAAALRDSRSQNATLNAWGKNVKYRPSAFTEHGAVMLASVLRTPMAIQASVHVVRAFIRLREILATHKELGLRLDQVERDSLAHATRINFLFDEIQKLQEPPASKPRRIGFELKELGRQRFTP